MPTGAPAATIPEDRTQEHSRIAHELRVQRFLQPDDVTCGPTCLRKVYDFYGLELELGEVMGEIERNEDGGTLAVYLGIAACKRGFQSRIYSYDLRIFDPTWFALPREALTEKVRARLPFLRTEKAGDAARAYLRFLEMGGQMAFDELTPGLLKSILDRDHPILAGLSATYLYRMMRERHDERDDTLVDDDVRGSPTGHFVVITGYEHWGRAFSLRDPSEHVPVAEHGRVVVDAQRLINAILLGDLTYDAVLLEVWRADGYGGPEVTRGAFAAGGEGAA
jgi:hypothetical protein